MAAVGMRLAMAKHFLLVRNQEMENASVQLVSEGMVLKNVKTSMSAKRRKHVSARNVAVRTPGEAMSALVAGTFST